MGSPADFASMTTAWMCPSMWFTAIRQRFRKAECFGVGNPDKQRSDQTRTLSYGDCIQAFEQAAGVFQRFPNYRHDRTKVFSRGQFGNDSAVFAVGVELRRNYRRQHTDAVLDHSRGSFVARRLDCQDSSHAIVILRLPFDASGRV